MKRHQILNYFKEKSRNSLKNNIIRLNNYVEKEVQYKAYRFRLRPTEEQSVLLSKHFGCVRFVYNHFLKEKQDHYLLNKKTLNYNTCAGNLVKMKREGFEWLKDVNSQALQSALMNLETAYGNFFKKKSKFPKFKSILSLVRHQL